MDTVELFQDLQHHQAELGRMFPPEFLTAMQLTAEITVTSWLDANGCPRQVADLVRWAVQLERLATLAHHDRKAQDPEAADLLAELPAITRTIAELGGEFHAPGSVCARDPITWPSPWLAPIE